MLKDIEQPKGAPESPGLTEQEAEAAARAVIRLFQRWDLADAEAREILGGLPARTYARWKSGDIGRIDRDLGTRLSLLLGIHKALRYLFTDPARGYRWVKSNNSVFGGRTPVAVMAQGDIFSLMRVHAYLNAERGGW